MKNKRILIAYDGSPCSEASLEDLKRAGLPSKVEAVVLSIADVFLPPAEFAEESIPESVVTAVRRVSDHASKVLEDSKRLAEKGADRLRAGFPTWKIHAESFADSPAWGILKKAREWKADLIVIGAHGWSAPERLILGSISQRVAAEAPCSVRVVHKKPEDVKSPPRIVVGVDGSVDSDKAILEVASRQWIEGTTVHLVTVVDSRVITSLFASEFTLQKRIRENRVKEHHWVSWLTEAAADELRAKGLAVTHLNKEGNSKKALLEEAECWGADCIFVGGRGLAGIKHFLIGSVSSSLAARAHCTVEIVRTRPKKTVPHKTSIKRMNRELQAEAYD